MRKNRGRKIFFLNHQPLCYYPFGFFSTTHVQHTQYQFLKSFSSFSSHWIYVFWQGNNNNIPCSACILAFLLCSLAASRYVRLTFSIWAYGGGSSFWYVGPQCDALKQAFVRWLVQWIHFWDLALRHICFKLIWYFPSFSFPPTAIPGCIFLSFMPSYKR